MNTVAILCVLIAIGAAFFSWCSFTFDNLDGKIKKVRVTIEGALPDSQEEIEKVWSRESWSGKNPFKVIALAYIIAERYRLGYQKSLHLTTSYYSQVKFLIKKGHITTAMVFFLRTRWYGLQTLLERSGDLACTGGTFRKAIDLEVIGAPDFLLTRLPLIGSLFRRRALQYLLAANEEVLETEKIRKLSGPDYRTPNGRMDRALIWGKLYILGLGEEYRNQVLTINFRKDNRDRDRGQYDRIARLIGFKNADELFAHLDAADAVENEPTTAVSAPSEAQPAAEQPSSEAPSPAPSRLSPVPFAKRVDPSSPGPKAILKRTVPAPASDQEGTSPSEGSASEPPPQEGPEKQ